MITSLDLHSDHWDSIPFRNKIKERLTEYLPLEKQQSEKPMSEIIFNDC